MATTRRSAKGKAALDQIIFEVLTRNAIAAAISRADEWLARKKPTIPAIKNARHRASPFSRDTSSFLLPLSGARPGWWS
jgi:hypothetical protein